MKRRLIIVALLLVAATGLAANYLPLPFLVPRMERALERGLGRRVEIEEVYFSLFTGPGFTLENVTIHEDPRAGIEPFAYVTALEARVRLVGLLRRRLEFSSLRLDDATINLVKTDAGPWNFQFLLGQSPSNPRSVPSVKMRAGRVNFKFGDTKSVFYFNDADLDVAPSEDGSVELRFSGAPSRTDRSAQDFGHFFVRGNWAGQQVGLKVELERSPIEEVARLMAQRGPDLHGIVSFEAQLAGSPSHLDVTGQFQVEDIHRWDLLPQRGGGWTVPYKGVLDLSHERLQLESASESPDPLMALHFKAWGFLSTPHWDVSGDFNKVPLATLFEVARHMGVAFPEKLTVEGSVSGSICYSDAEGPSGRAEMQNASLTLPGAQTLRAESAVVTMDRHTMSLEPSSVSVGEDESADLEGKYTIDDGGGLDLKITTRGLNVADLHSFGLARVPVIEQTPRGTWRGWARYVSASSGAGEWSGEYELQNASIDVDGLTDPVRIQSASVSLNGARAVVTKLRARVGTIAFTGDYRWEPAAIRPHKFHLAIPTADASELERIMAPTLVRERGFLARTLRLAPDPVPDWLKDRRGDGTLSVGSLTVGDNKIRIDTARVLWDATLVRVAGVSAHMDQTALSGDLGVDLSGQSPHYRFDGKLQDVPFKGGKLDLEGTAEADEAGVEFVSSLHGDGRLHGRAIAFTPDADFRSVTGCFEIVAAAGPRLKLSELEVVQGQDNYAGQGSTLSDGRLLLELGNRSRLFRYTATLFALAPQ